MNLLLVEDDPRVRDMLRLGIAKAAKGETPTLFEATTVSDTLPILQGERIDAVLSDGAFLPDWGGEMDDLCLWAADWRLLYRECRTRGVPFVHAERRSLDRRGRSSAGAPGLQQAL